jgi:hypothetical protein
LVCPQQKPLGDFQNSSPVGQKVILKLTTKPVICAARPVACAQENPLRDDILCATNILCTTESTARQHPMRDKIHVRDNILCATKSTARRNPLSYARQNPLRDTCNNIHCATEIHCTTKSTARRNPLHDKILCMKCSAQRVENFAARSCKWKWNK